MEFVRPLPFAEAIEKLGERNPVTSILKSADWRHVPVGLRERAFFSATCENVRFLARAQQLLTQFLTSENGVNERGAAYLKAGSRAEFVKVMQRFALAEGMKPLDSTLVGTTRDLRSQKRLELIFDTNVKAAQDYGYWKQGMDVDVLDAFPAQRFIRVAAVKSPRPWHQAALGAVRLKTDLDFWIGLNRDFEVPWGPWGFNSGCDVEDVGRREAEQLGLIGRDEMSRPIEREFNDRLEASTRGLDEPHKNLLRLAFGEQAEIDGDAVRWKPRVS